MSVTLKNPASTAQQSTSEQLFNEQKAQLDAFGRSLGAGADGAGSASGSDSSRQRLYGPGSAEWFAQMMAEAKEDAKGKEAGGGGDGEEGGGGDAGGGLAQGSGPRSPLSAGALSGGGTGVAAAAGADEPQGAQASSADANFGNLPGFDSTVAAGRDGRVADATENFATMLSKGLVDDSNLDVQALIQKVLRECYEGQSKDVNLMAKKLQYTNAYKDSLRTELSAARTAAASANGDNLPTPFVAKQMAPYSFNGSANLVPPTDQEKQNFDPTKPVYTSSSDSTASANSTTASKWSSGQTSSKAAVDAYVDNLNDSLDAAGGDSQMDQQNLQNLVQKMQETMNNLTQLSKNFHDTAMKTIGNI